MIILFSFWLNIKKVTLNFFLLNSINEFCWLICKLTNLFSYSKHLWLVMRRSHSLSLFTHMILNIYLKRKKKKRKRNWIYKNWENNKYFHCWCSHTCVKIFTYIQVNNFLLRINSASICIIHMCVFEETTREEIIPQCKVTYDTLEKITKQNSQVHI